MESRESGENPEQSRCCKPDKNGSTIPLQAMWEGMSKKDRVSQKTCHFLLIVDAFGF